MTPTETLRPEAVAELAAKVAIHLVPENEAETTIPCFLYVPKDVPRDAFRNWRRDDIRKAVEEVLAGNWPLHAARLLEVEQRVKELEGALKIAAEPIAVLKLTDDELPYRELCPELRALVHKAEAAIRKALAHKESP